MVAMATSPLLAPPPCLLGCCFQLEWGTGVGPLATRARHKKAGPRRITSYEPTRDWGLGGYKENFRHPPGGLLFFVLPFRPSFLGVVTPVRAQRCTKLASRYL